MYIGPQAPTRQRDSTEPCFTVVVYSSMPRMTPTFFRQNGIVPLHSQRISVKLHCNLVRKRSQRTLNASSQRRRDDRTAH
jgi:hypothetical protein